MVLTRTHGIDKDLWYRQQLMVLTTPMVLTKTHGIESVILNHTHVREGRVLPVCGIFSNDIEQIGVPCLPDPV